eukprot:7382025-Prymnesium_polylepis.1
MLSTDPMRSANSARSRVALPRRPTAAAPSCASSRILGVAPEVETATSNVLRGFIATLARLSGATGCQAIAKK